MAMRVRIKMAIMRPTSMPTFSRMVETMTILSIGNSMLLRTCQMPTFNQIPTPLGTQIMHWTITTRTLSHPEPLQQIQRALTLDTRVLTNLHNLPTILLLCQTPQMDPRRMNSGLLPMANINRCSMQLLHLKL